MILIDLPGSLSNLGDFWDTFLQLFFHNHFSQFGEARGNVFLLPLADLFDFDLFQSKFEGLCVDFF